MYEGHDLYKKWRKNSIASHWYWGMESDDLFKVCLPVAGGFWLRAAAWLIDKIILTAISLFFLLAIYLAGADFPLQKDSGILIYGLLSFLSLEILRVAYYVIFHATDGQTIGKAVLGIKVIDADGNPPTLWQAYRRRMAHFFSIITFGLGYLWMIFDAKKQTLHDKIADTYVVLI
ncbi:MAG: RDD family protein [Candidatus Schekmanbacteria bacterium]|nr:RDD family protein [Candidatus Schekmanbacteria bacterium]